MKIIKAILKSDKSFLNMPYKFLGFAYVMYYCNKLVQSLLQLHLFLKKEFFEKVLESFFGGFNVLIKTIIILIVFLTVFF